MRSSRLRRSLRSSLWLYLSIIAFPLAWMLLDQLEVLRPVQNLTMDARFKARGPLASPVKVVYVDIDTEAVTKLGSFPWDRGIFSKVCDLLVNRLHVKAVGIDVVFSSAGIPNIADMEKFDRGQLEFGRFLFNEPPVVVAASYASAFQVDLDGEVAQRLLPEVSRLNGVPSADLPEVPEWNLGVMIYTPSLVGLIDTTDGHTRQVPIYAPTTARNYYHISLELARLHFGLRPEDIQIYPDRLELKPAEGDLVRSVPLIDGQMVDINWFSPWIDDGNPRYSIFDFYDVAQALLSENAEMRQQGEESLAEVAEEFRDAIVMIGPVDPLMQDLAPTPFDTVPVPKVGVHGNMVKTIVSGRFLKRPPAWTLPVITIALTALVAGLSLFSDGRRSAICRVVAGLVLVGYITLCHLAFSWGDWVLPLTVPLGSALSLGFIGGAAQLVLAQKQKSRIKGLFGAYLAPTVVEEMVDSGQEPKLGGVEEEITAYFSDVQSFSTFSEVLSATQLVELMNEYLTACTDIVQAEGGTLDKYVGDAVVAMYGAPLALPGHALRAAVAALRVERRCAELREKWSQEVHTKGWPEIVTRLRTRVGLNTGRAVVGNMGSASRFSYTMMGDTVNLAARMESGAKAWGVFTMCAEPTRLACQMIDAERVVFRSLGRVVVKGRSQPVPIHELVGLKEDVGDRTREAVACFEEGLARYYAQDWEGALARFRESATLEPNQPDVTKGIFGNPSLVYQQLVGELRANPPGPDWNGAYVMHGK